MDEYDSSFETESELGESVSKKRKTVRDYDDEIFKKPSTKLLLENKSSSNSNKQGLMIEEYSREERHRRVNFHSLDAYTRHKLLINYYVLTHPSKVSETFTRDKSRDKTDFQVLLENHRFIWNEDDLASAQLTWGQRVAKKYYDQLFKEYCIADLSRYRENKFGMRWRTETEVVNGKGQFICGAKKCPIRDGLSSWEVLFSYRENGEKLSALVKLRLCVSCSEKLNYHHAHKKVKREKKKKLNTKNSNKVNTESEEQTSSSASHIDPKIVVKEEELTDNETELSEQNYEQLIEKIWRQPVKIESEDTEPTLEQEVDDYLNQLFL